MMTQPNEYERSNRIIKAIRNQYPIEKEESSGIAFEDNEMNQVLRQTIKQLMEYQSPNSNFKGNQDLY